MATSGSVNSGAYQGRYLKFEWGTNSTSSAANTRNIWYKITATGGSGSYYHHNNSVLLNNIELLPSQYRADSVYIAKDTVLANSNLTIDQNVEPYIILEMYGGIYNYSGTLENTDELPKDWGLDPIPRYTTITSFTVSKRNETSVTYNFTTSDVCDYAWYSKDNGTNWTGVDITDGTSASFVVSNLNPNTSYNFKVRVRRKDSQLNTTSNAVSQTTYKVPTQSLSSKTETRATIAWSIDSTANYIWYSTNNGGSWTAVGSVNATSGNYTITGLSPNTAYNIKTRVRRSGPQTTYDTAVMSVTTYKAPTQSLNTKTETTIKMNWSADSTIDYIWYSKDNGSNWTGVDVTDGTSGSYTITGLNPNTAYNIKTRVRRKSTQTTYDTSALSVTTYAAPTQSFNTKTETSIKMNWSADSTIDYIWYSKDNGSNWTGVNVTDGTSGSYTISSLTANATYNIKTRLRRKSTQTTYDTSALSVTTYNYPYVTAVGTSNLVIGNSQTLTLYNPLSRNVTIKMYKDNTSGTELYSGTSSGTSKTFTPTASTLYASIPNATEGKCVYSIIYGSSSTKTTSQHKYKVIGTEVPTFSNFTYADTNSTITALTGNNQILVSGYSNVTATISTANKATAKNSATMKNYTLAIGTQSVQTNYSSSSAVTMALSKVTSGSIKVTATDSRGLSTIVSKTATIKNYAKPAVTRMTATRSNNGVGETVTLAFNGTWWNSSFGSVSNVIQNIKYYFKKSTASSWTTGSTTITFSTSNNTFSGNLEIYGDTETHGFDVTSSYFIKIVVTDKLDKSEEYQVTIGTGTPAIAIYKDNVAIGQQYNTSINAKLQVNGSINVPYSNNNGAYKVNGNLVLRHNSNGNTLLIGNGSTMYLRPNGSDATSGQVTLGTNGNLSASKFSGPLEGNVTGNVTGNASSATYTTNIRVTPTATASNTTYYLPFVDGNSADTNYVPRTNDGLRYNSKNGTTSDYGSSILIIGNGIATGTAGNKRGGLRLFAKTSHYMDLIATETASTDVQHILPTTGGTLLNTGTTSVTQTLTSGTEIGTIKINGTDTKLYCQTNTDKNVQIVETNPTSGTWYYPIWHTGVSGTGTMKANDGLRYYSLQGTTLANGRTILQVGNGTKSGTAGNKYGQLRLYHTNTGSATLQYRDTTTSCTLTLPAHDGNMIERNNLYSNTSGTTGNVTLSETAANFDALEITYKDSTNSRYGYTKVYNPDGKGFNLQYAEFGSSTGAAVLFGRSYSISGTTITASSNYGYMGLADSAATHTNRFQIVRVDGIKG